MVLESKSQSPPVMILRPTTLHLGSTHQEVNNNSGVKTLVTDDDVELARNKRRKKRRSADVSLKRFSDLYVDTGEVLGEGSFGLVKTFRHVTSKKDFAVKTIVKNERRCRSKVLKEIEIFHYCQGNANILQLIEYFEEENQFFLIFEKMEGGTLLDMIERRGHLTEQEARLVICDVARALSFLHKKGIAHRDLKPENILCVMAGQLTPVKLCDFDLGSGIQLSSKRATPVSTPELQSPVGSVEFMAPEVVDVWQDQAWSYDKRCDLWSVGIILYILLCGYPPFCGSCGRNCGWKIGKACNLCQDLLFNSIQEGVYGFPEPEWSGISRDAKDLIGHLLVRDPHQRYSADQILSHPWVTAELPKIQLATPKILQRDQCVRELELYAENANVFNRLLYTHLSFTGIISPQGRGVDDDGFPVQTEDSIDEDVVGGLGFEVNCGPFHTDEGSNGSWKSGMDEESVGSWKSGIDEGFVGSWKSGVDDCSNGSWKSGAGDSCIVKRATGEEHNDDADNEFLFFMPRAHVSMEPVPELLLSVEPVLDQEQ